MQDTDAGSMFPELRNCRLTREDLGSLVLGLKFRDCQVIKHWLASINTGTPI